MTWAKWLFKTWAETSELERKIVKMWLLLESGPLFGLWILYYTAHYPIWQLALGYLSISGFLSVAAYRISMEWADELEKQQ